MGKRGPAPKPTALRVLHGDRKDRVNTAEPVPPTQPVAAPEWLGDKARTVWDRLAPGLIGRGVLTVWDVDAFAACCHALVRYQDAARLLDQSSLLVASGPRLEPNPVLKVLQDADVAFGRWAARFGLTPSDRQALKTEVTRDAGSGADLLTS